VLAAVCVAIAAGAAVLTLWSRWDQRTVRVAVSAPRVTPRFAGSEWLRQAGVDSSPHNVVAGAVGGALAAFAVVAIATRTPLVAIPPALGVAVLPFLLLAQRRRTRLRAWQSAWPDALRELIAAIVAGRSLTQGINTLGATGPEPLREVFADFPALARVFGTAGALERVKERMADPTSDRVIEVLIVAHERGGAIVREVLEDLVVATTRDVKLAEEIDTDGLEMRINGRAVLVLPWLVLVALTLRPGPFRAFYRSGAGLIVIVAAGALSAAGGWWLGRLGAQAEEPRVFAGLGGAADNRERHA
jgi:tight adherence protein B